MLFISYVDWKGLEDSDWCNRKESPKDGQRHFTLSQKHRPWGDLGGRTEDNQPIVRLPLKGTGTYMTSQGWPVTG